MNKDELKNDLINFAKWYNSHTLGHPIHIKNIDNYLSTIKEQEEKDCKHKLISTRAGYQCSICGEQFNHEF